MTKIRRDKIKLATAEQTRLGWNRSIHSDLMNAQPGH